MLALQYVQISILGDVRQSLTIYIYIISKGSL